MNDAKKTALELLRYGIRKSDTCNLSNNDVAWNDVIAFSELQGITALVLDGLDRCINQGKRVDVDFQTKMEWIGNVQQKEVIYKQHKRVICDLANFYQQHGIKMMLMKGVGLSLDYPSPSHRPCGDIDIYLYGDLEKGDYLIKKEYGIEINTERHKHTVFTFEDVKIENHYDFANHHKHKSSKKLDNWLKKDSIAGSKECTDIGANVFLPSANFDAVFLIRHAASHFAAEEIVLRHLLDWAFFVEKHYDEVDWEWQWEICKEQNMHKFLLAINNICVHNLGFDASKFRTGGDEALTERVLNEILSSTFQEDIAKGNSIYIRCRRWWANRWKHKIVYPENLTTTFIHQVYAHLMKPATIIR